MFMPVGPVVSVELLPFVFLATDTARQGESRGAHPNTAYKIFPVHILFIKMINAMKYSDNVPMDNNLVSMGIC